MKIAITGRAWMRLYAMTVILLGFAILGASRGNAQNCWEGYTCDGLSCQEYIWWDYCDFNCSAECWPWWCERVDLYCTGGVWCHRYSCVVNV
jgi:hypothetical protein